MKDKMENLRKQMGIPDQDEAPKDKKDVVMPTFGAKSDLDKKAEAEEKEVQSKIIIPGLTDNKNQPGTKKPLIMEM
jgi:hypothetical protein